MTRTQKELNAGGVTTHMRNVENVKDGGDVFDDWLQEWKTYAETADLVVCFNDAGATV